MTNVAGFSKTTNSIQLKIAYSDCESALKPVPHSVEDPSQFHMHATILKVTEYRCDNTENCKQDLARKSRQVHKIITYAWSVVVDTHPSSMPCNEIKMPSRLRDKKTELYTVVEKYNGLNIGDGCKQGQQFTMARNEKFCGTFQRIQLSTMAHSMQHHNPSKMQFYRIDRC